MTATEVDANEVSFNPEIIALAWEGFDDGIPAVAAAALVNEFVEDVEVNANKGDETDRDVMFREAGVHVEEKAMGVCDRETAKEHAPAYIELDERGDEKVLAFNLAQIFTGISPIADA